MKSRQFPSLDEAIQYLESVGELKYWGWEGQVDGYYVYSIRVKGVKFSLRVFKNGRVEMEERRYV